MHLRRKVSLVAAQGTLLACLLVPGHAFAFAANTPAPSTQAAAQPTAQAQTDPTNGAVGFVPLTHLPQIQALSQQKGFATFVNTFYKILIGVGAVLAVLMIMYAGFEFMKSTGSVTGNEKAKNRIRNAIFGLLLILAPTIVFGIINPDILNLNLGTEFEQLKQGATPDQSASQSNVQGGPASNTCPANPKAVEGACPAGNYPVTKTCCGGASATSVCCAPQAQGTGKAYLLYAYAIYTNSSTKAKCYTEIDKYYATQDVCNYYKTSVDAGFPIRNSSSRSNITFVKSCELGSVSELSHTIPGNPPLCPS